MTILPSRIAIALAFASLLSARADVVSLSVTSDSYVVSSNPDNNGGAQSFLTVGVDKAAGVHRALFKFDLTSIPSGSVVTSAVFTETVTGLNNAFVSSTFDLLRLQAGWNEGTGIGSGLGSPAGAGEVSWTYRMFNLQVWTNAGGDFAATPLASTAITAASPYDWSGTGLIDAVQDWVANPDSNFGMILATESEGTSATFCKIGAREGGSPATLTIGYAPPASPPSPPQPVITSMTIISNHVQLAWTATNAANYEVFRTVDLSGTQSWTTADANIGGAPSGTNVWADLFFSTQTNRIFFYRVRAGPPAS